MKDYLIIIYFIFVEVILQVENFLESIYVIRVSMYYKHVHYTRKTYKK